MENKMEWGTELWDKYSELCGHTSSGIDFLDGQVTTMFANLRFGRNVFFRAIILNPGVDVMILKIFSPKKFAKILAVFLQTTTASFYKNLFITLVFVKNANFSPKFGKNRRKL
jgi:hypothetical protein